MNYQMCRLLTPWYLHHSFVIDDAMLFLRLYDSKQHCLNFKQFFLENYIKLLDFWKNYQKWKSEMLAFIVQSWLNLLRSTILVLWDSSVSRSQAHFLSVVQATIFVRRKDKTNYLSNQTWAKCYNSRNKH